MDSSSLHSDTRALLPTASQKLGRSKGKLWLQASVLASLCALFIFASTGIVTSALLFAGKLDGNGLCHGQSFVLFPVSTCPATFYFLRGAICTIAQVALSSQEHTVYPVSHLLRAPSARLAQELRLHTHPTGPAPIALTGSNRREGQHDRLGRWAGN